MVYIDSISKACIFSVSLVGEPSVDLVVNGLIASTENRGTTKPGSSVKPVIKPAITASDDDDDDDDVVDLARGAGGLIWQRWYSKGVLNRNRTRRAIYGTTYYRANRFISASPIDLVDTISEANTPYDHRNALSIKIRATTSKLIQYHPILPFIVDIYCAIAAARFYCTSREAPSKADEDEATCRMHEQIMHNILSVYKDISTDEEDVFLCHPVTESVATTKKGLPSRTIDNAVANLGKDRDFNAQPLPPGTTLVSEAVEQAGGLGLLRQQSGMITKLQSMRKAELKRAEIIVAMGGLGENEIHAPVRGNAGGKNGVAGGNNGGT